MRFFVRRTQTPAGGSPHLSIEQDIGQANHSASTSTGQSVLHSTPPTQSTATTTTTTGAHTTSPIAKATLNAFKFSLDCLEKAPIPGIGVITTSLSRVINNIQAMSDAATGWQELAERLERLVFLLTQIEAFGNKLKARAEQLLKPMQE
jgi:hypothetical protein